MILRLCGYQITDQIYESSNSLVYRGYREADDQPVILKILRETYPSPERLAWYKREYNITHNLNLPGVIQAYALETDQQRLVMVLEDFGGTSLAQLKLAGTLDLEQFLQLAISITQILGQIHATNIIHKDINPSNIVFNPTTGQIKIIDFGISTVLSRETQSFKNPNVLEGTIAYISPEQTGRMNRVIDYRSDFYSLGVTFYELLTGQVPFQEEDALALVHCHIAKQPLPPHEIIEVKSCASLPPVISDIILKLMAKNAEDRYQSAYGIQVDLEKCLHQLPTNKKINAFSLGSQDVSDRFTIGQKLYGREREIETLLAAFDRVSSTTTELILVAGYSGVGKSSLVNEVHKPITAKRGNFIAGKYDQYQCNIPYYAIFQAFNDLCNQLLTESESALKQWQEKILAAVGNNGQVLIDVIPNFKWVIGEQPPVAQVGGQEAQNRFNLVFQNFIKAICQPEHPLVLFVDDLQWVDNASLNLLKIILGDRDIHHLLVIGAYRDNEIDTTHPFGMLLQEIKKEEGVVSEICLNNLIYQDINALIAETLSCSINRSQSLTNVVYDKTQGNAFFVIELLRKFYTDEILTFDYRERQWEWDIEQIQTWQITENVVDLIVIKIDNLSEKTQFILKFAACIGNIFDLSTLAITSQMRTDEVIEKLFPALQEGLVIPLNNKYKLAITGDEIYQASEVKFKFQHDRVQQAVYSLIEDDRKKYFHLLIGRLLKSNMSDEERFDRIFELVDHLNLGLELITNEPEKIELATLNLAAGEKAKAATAYAAALQYLKSGINCLTRDFWGEHYDLALALHKVQAETEYLNGNFEQSESLIKLILSQSRTHLEKAEIYNLLIVQYTMSAKYSEAIQAGRDALALLGIELPENDLQNVLNSQLSEAKKLLIDRDVALLINHSEMTLPDKKVALKLLMNIDPAAYISNQDLYPIIVTKSVILSLQYGNAPESAKGYSTYGIILGSILGDYQSGYEFGFLALKLSEKFNNPAHICKSCFVFAGFISHWLKPIKYVEPINTQGYQAGLESGEFQFSGYILSCKLLDLFNQGENLETLVSQLPTCLLFAEKIKNQWAIDLIMGLQLITFNLNGLTKGKLDFDDLTKIFEVQYVEDLKLQKGFCGICFYQIFKSQVFYLYEEYTESLNCTLIAQEYIPYIVGFFCVAEHNFYYSLNLASLYSEVSAETKKEYLEKLETNQKQMAIWADNCQENFQHKYLLVAAEMARISGNDLEAMDLYDQAIASADHNGFTQNTAMANELAAKFWLSKGKEEFAQLYLRKAHYGYQLWGAKRKVEDLEQRYPQFFTQTVRESPLQASRTTNTSISDTTLSESLDLNSVLKASQALGGEIKLDTLLTKLMRIVIENAGAQKGYLLLNQQGQWQIEALGTLDSDSVKVREAIPIESVSRSSDLPMVSHAIINYVIRTQDSVVLHNAANEGNFTRDPYIQQQQPQSILCFPLLNQGKLTGIVYLENNLTTGAFTPERVELLNLLSSQAAISIENATIYNTLEQKVAERTQQLYQTLKDLQATQKQLVESEKMAALGSLVAGVAHEINTPVGTSITVASTLADETRSFIQAVEQGQLKRSVLNNYLAVAQESSDLIVNNLYRAGELVQSFKQVAVDQTSLERRKFRVKPYLEEILTSLTPKLKETSHTLRVEGDETVRIDSYPGAFAQLVTNLVMNSLTHAYQPGEAGQLCLEVKRQGQEALILYRDDGCGIAPENLSRIFEPFFTTARQQGGSGLGLHIVYNLVTQTLQGTIAVHSDVEKGTLFTVTLPLSTGD